MSYLDIPPLRKYTERALSEIFNMIQQAVNNINVQNFRNKVPGDRILTDASTAIKKLAWTEWQIPLLLPASAFSTASTTGDNVGGLFAWDPAKMPGGTWYLEATIASGNAAATATLSLMGGANEIGLVSTTGTTQTRLRSNSLVMPGAGDLNLKLKTNNATYPAWVSSARLIFVP